MQEKYGNQSKLDRITIVNSNEFDQPHSDKFDPIPFPYKYEINALWIDYAKFRVFESKKKKKCRERLEKDRKQFGW